jgi:hypothetical protein
MTSKEALHIISGKYSTTIGHMEWEKYRTLKLLSIIKVNIMKGEIVDENDLISIKFYLDREIENVNNGIFNESDRSVKFQLLLGGIALVPFVIIYSVIEEFTFLSILVSMIFSICLFRVLNSKRIGATINGAKKGYYTDMLGNLNDIVTERLKQIKQKHSDEVIGKMVPGSLLI